MEEVSLRDLIEVLLRGKWIIAVVAIAAVITSGVLSFFVLPPVYEASATLMVNQPGVQPNLSVMGSVFIVFFLEFGRNTTPGNNLVSFSKLGWLNLSGEA